MLSINDLVDIGDFRIVRLLGEFGNMCVAMFAVSSGYVAWKLQHKYNTYRKVFPRFVKFLLSFWVILGVYIIYGLLFDEPMPVGIQILRSLVGESTGADYVYVRFSWYVTYYLFWLVIAPLVILMFNKTGKRPLSDFLIISGVCVLINVVRMSGINEIGFLRAICSGLIGVWIAKYDLFNKADKKYSVNYVLGTFLLIALVLGRYALKKVYYYDMEVIDPLMASIVIFAVISMYHRYNLKPLSKIIAFLGVYSMNIWFLHGLFFTCHYKIQPILYYPQYWILILMWGLILVTPLAVLCSKIQKPVSALVDKWFDKSKSIIKLDRNVS